MSEGNLSDIPSTRMKDRGGLYGLTNASKLLGWPNNGEPKLHIKFKNVKIRDLCKHWILKVYLLESALFPFLH